MQKKSRNSKHKTLDDYILLTDKNYKHAIFPGVHLYFISKSGKQFEVTGTGDVRPQLRKGWYKVFNALINGRTTNYQFFSTEDESSEDYNKRVMAPLLFLIQKGNVYISKLKTISTQYNHED